MGVPAQFHSRYDANSRSYLYKLAIFPDVGNIVDNSQRFHQWMVPPLNSNCKLRKLRRRQKSINECLTTKLSLLETDTMYCHQLKDGQTFDFESKMHSFDVDFSVTFLGEKDKRNY